MAGPSTPILSILLIPLIASIVLYIGVPEGLPFGNLLRLNVPVSQVGSVLRDIANNITYLGTANAGVEQFLDIFYGQDTSGNNRFAPPIPFVPEPGSIIDATKLGAWCPQGTGGPPLPFTSPITNISENCLSLGITRPESTRQNAKLPVIVWIHGGGHALGSYADHLYRPEGLVKQSVTNGQPVIFVGINYRLGLFGFARSQPLLKSGHTNAGLRDQRAAFEWIQKNIAVFGGDPDNVISMGQSVGASDTGLHLVSYGGKKGVPFHKAIMMSGAPNLNFNIKSDLVDNNTASVASALGCVGGSSQSVETLACLRRAPMEKLMEISVAASRAARPPFGEGYFYPTYDNDYIPDQPSKLLRQGKFVQNIPMIASWVSNDGAWYAPPTTVSDEEVIASFTTWLFNLSNSTLSKLLDLYPLNDFLHMVRQDVDGAISPQYYRAAQMNRDLWFTCPVLDFTYQYAVHSPGGVSTPYIYEHNATRFSPVFKNIMKVPFWRVSHLSDIPYMLNNDVAAGADNSKEQKDLANLLSQHAIHFAHTGHPSSVNNGSHEWKPAFEAAPAAASTTSRQKSPNTPNKINLMRFAIGTADNGGSGSSRLVSVARNNNNDKKAEEDSEGNNNAEEEEGRKAVEWEKLFERCDFINSDAVRAEIGV